MPDRLEPKTTPTFEPITLANQLLIPDNPDRPDMAVICCWTKRKKMAEQWKKNFDGQMPAVFGQMYSPLRGIDPLVRNLLANPQITSVVVCGKDMANSRKMLWEFARLLDHAEYQPENIEAIRRKCGVGADITDAAMRQLSGSLEIVFLEPEHNVNEHRFTVEHCSGRGGVREAFIFEPPSPKPAIRFPGHAVGASVHGNSIAEAWLRMLQYIQRHGKITDTHYDMQQREVFNLTTVVYDDDGDWPDWLPMDDVDLYADRLWSGELPEGLAYTYGHRMRHGFAREYPPQLHEGDAVHEMLGTVDQVEGAITKLLENPDQRSACVSLWYGSDSHVKSGTPCVMVIQFCVVEDQFHMGVYIRSNDMFGAWPSNLAGFRRFQKRVLREIKTRVCAPVLEDTDGKSAFWSNIKLGATATISGSAHYYDDCWEAVDEVLDRHFKEVCGRGANPSDPFGNWIIRLREPTKMEEPSGFLGRCRVADPTFVPPLGVQVGSTEPKLDPMLAESLRGPMAELDPTSREVIGFNLSDGSIFGGVTWVPGEMHTTPPLYATLPNPPGIEMDLVDAEGKLIETLRGDAEHELRRRVAGYVHDSDHAMYLGAEILKARLCAMLGIPYMQDQITAWQIVRATEGGALTSSQPVESLSDPVSPDLPEGVSHVCRPARTAPATLQDAPASPENPFVPPPIPVGAQGWKNLRVEDGPGARFSVKGGSSNSHVIATFRDKLLARWFTNAVNEVQKDVPVPRLPARE